MTYSELVLSVKQRGQVLENRASLTWMTTALRAVIRSLLGIPEAIMDMVAMAYVEPFTCSNNSARRDREALGEHFHRARQ